MPETSKAYTLEEIDALVGAITPGEWKACQDGRCQCGMVWAVSEDVCVSEPCLEQDLLLSDDAIKRNARFIAAAPTVVRQLLKMVRHRDMALEEYRKRDEAEHNP